MTLTIIVGTQGSDDEGALAALEADDDSEAAFDAPADDYDSEAEADIAAYKPPAGEKVDREKLQLKQAAKKAVKQAAQAAAASPSARQGVLYVGHVPYGFFEKAMRAYLSQFGEIRHLRLARNKRTGRSKHYGFVQFADPAVAKVVADTMNGYFLYGRTLVVHEVPPADVHPHTFWMADRKFRPMPWRQLARRRHNQPRDDRHLKARAHALLVHERHKRRHLASLGVQYSFPGYVSCPVPLLLLREAL
jgi:nucleolar protein 15